MLAWLLGQDGLKRMDTNVQTKSFKLSNILIYMFEGKFEELILKFGRCYCQMCYDSKIDDGF